MIDTLITAASNTEIWVNLIGFLAGTAIHIGKKCYVEDIPLRDYLKGESGRTILSGTGLISSFITATMLYPDAPVQVYTLCGYFIDSFLNKAPAKR